MWSIADRIVRLLVSVLISGCLIEVRRALNKKLFRPVMGETVQKVGYRAMIQKQAIMYNLAGYARNDRDGTVGVRLQGDKERIDKTLEAISAGTKTSSKANIIGKTPAALDLNLKTFTVFGWTSQSRKIFNPYDLVFTLRPTDDEISAKEARAIWNTIAESVLKGEDLANFMKHLEDDELLLGSRACPRGTSGGSRTSPSCSAPLRRASSLPCETNWRPVPRSAARLGLRRT
jgi:acylphosphatase